MNDPPKKRRTAMVIGAPLEHVERVIESTLDGMRARGEKLSASKCDLFVLVADCPQGDKEGVEQRILRKTRRYWKNLNMVLCPEPLEHLSQMSRRGRQKRLAEYMADTLIPRVIRGTGSDRRVGLIWNPDWLAWVAAGSAASAAIDEVAWWEPPAAPDVRLLPNRRTANEYRKPTADGTTTLLGESEGIAEVRQRLELFAPLPYPVLLIGETGTGKELCARMLHEHGARDGALASINGAMLDPALASSDLFGHKKGAFTGADFDRKGRIREAEEGTFFLDELSSVPISAQSKLLRALQDAEQGLLHVTPVGGQRDDHEKLTIRFVSALQRDPLEHEDIRADLYFRVAGLELSLPPLRERKDDALMLTEHFIECMYERHGDGPNRIDKNVRRIFREYDWPGNVRELDQIIREAWLVAGARGSSTISEKDLPRRFRRDALARSPFHGETLRERVARYVVDQAEEAFERFPGNKTAAARALGFDTGQQLERYQEKHLKHLQGGDDA